MDVPALDKSASKLRSIWCGNVVWLSVSCWGTWWKGISSKWLKLIPNWWSISSRFSSWRKGLLSPDVGRAWSSVLDGVEEGQGGRKWSPLPSSSASIIEEAASILPGDQQEPPLPEKQTVTKLLLFFAHLRGKTLFAKEWMSIIAISHFCFWNVFFAKEWMTTKLSIYTTSVFEGDFLQ